MARKFGKRGKAGPGEPAGDPRDLFGAPQLPRNSARPASSTPLADQLNRGWPGVDAGYVVLPRSLAEGMSLPWQQQMAALLGQFHTEHGRLAWPIYRVVPSRYEKLIDLDEEQLAEAGYLVEMDTDGEMVYRERSGRKVGDPANTTVLVACLDPIPKPAQRQAPPPPPAGAPPGAAGPPPAAPRPPSRAPAPMNIGPAPVWHTVTPPPAAHRAPVFPEAGPPPGTVLPTGHGPGVPVDPGAVSPPGLVSPSTPASGVVPAVPPSVPVAPDTSSAPDVVTPVGFAPQAQAVVPPSTFAAQVGETVRDIESSSAPEVVTPVGFAQQAPAGVPPSTFAARAEEAVPDTESAPAPEAITPVGFTRQAPVEEPRHASAPEEPAAPISHALNGPALPQPSRGALSRALDQPGDQRQSPPVGNGTPPPGYAPPSRAAAPGWSSAPPPVDPHSDTPPRGTRLPPVDRGWFDELEGERPPESSKLDPAVDGGGEFGPTGDPTEIPYRYRQ
ncbi:hypothetical protein [Amycolatopsis sp. H20-H5]|uniref:hypothetical protein n=1 Tax=Amycolatopsis sp. H20-H5 TaxID=3046309 RepID=UPI003FA3D8BD